MYKKSRSLVSLKAMFISLKPTKIQLVKSSRINLIQSSPKMYLKASLWPIRISQNMFLISVESKNKKHRIKHQKPFLKSILRRLILILQLKATQLHKIRKSIKPKVQILLQNHIIWGKINNKRPIKFRKNHKMPKRLQDPHWSTIQGSNQIPPCLLQLQSQQMLKPKILSRKQNLQNLSQKPQDTHTAENQFWPSNNKFRFQCNRLRQKYQALKI